MAKIGLPLCLAGAVFIFPDSVFLGLLLLCRLQSTEKLAVRTRRYTLTGGFPLFVTKDLFYKNHNVQMVKLIESIDNGKAK